MDWVILIAGVVGLAVAGYGLVTLALDARHRGQYVDIVLALALVVVVVYVLITFGDRLLQ
ncbi:MAG TPA: hypothetical protein VIL79_12035 [Thermoleophilia bacterium]